MTEDDNKSCPICMEEYKNPFLSYSLFFLPFNIRSHYKQIKLSSCCNQHICDQCLYSHIKSILEEGITLQGRTSLSCPFNCNSTISDKCIRRSFATNGSYLHENENNNVNTLYHQLTLIGQCFKSSFSRIAYFVICSVFLNICIIIESCIQILTPHRIRRQQQPQPQPQQKGQQKSSSSSLSGNNRKGHDRLILWKYNLKYSLLKSRQEIQDLNLYERWSLTIALNCINHDNDNNNNNNNDNRSNSHGSDDSNDENGEKSKEGNKKTKEKGKKKWTNYDSINHNENEKNADHFYTHVTRCPTPDCKCLWLTNREYYNNKLQNERKYGSSDAATTTATQKKKTTSLTKFILQSATSYLFYKPIHPDQEEQILNRNGYTTEHWLNPNDINIFPTSNPFLLSLSNGIESTSDRREKLNRNADQNIDKDGRISKCPLCKNIFCNLCLNPWHTLHSKSGKFLSHTNITCSNYNKKSISSSDHDDFMNTANAIDARLCPGCSMRTNRTDGCNHMTCPCGYHWCYVCECKWDTRHYGCTDSNPLIVQDRNNANGCIVS